MASPFSYCTKAAMCYYLLLGLEGIKTQNTQQDAATTQ
jgi:hypothetical protein